MDGGEVVGGLGLVVSIGFVLAAVALTAQQRLRLGRPIVVALVRSLVQMAIVGVALVPIVDPDTPLVWSWAWVLAITVFSAVTVARRAPAVPGLLGVALLGMGLVAGTGLAMLFGLGVFALEGRTLVPVAGMIVGNSMKAAVVGASRVAEAVADNRPEIEAGLALGMTPRRASLRFVRSALRTAISPQVEQTAALGIVFLPGAMTGLILAGVEPLEAVRTQLALMYVILAEVVVAALTTGLGTLHRLTTDDQTLKPVPRRVD